MITHPPSLHSGNRNLDVWAERIGRTVRTHSVNAGMIGVSQTPHGIINQRFDVIRRRPLTPSGLTFSGLISIHGNVPIFLFDTGPAKEWIKVHLDTETAEWFEGPPVWGTDPYVRYFRTAGTYGDIVIP